LRIGINLKTKIKQRLFDGWGRSLVFVGIDSVKIELGNAPSVFEGLLGIAVTCKDEKTFVESYKACMKTALEKLGIKTRRIVLKAYDISKIVPERESEIIFPLLDCLNAQIEHIDVYYTRYNASKLPAITIYGKDQPTTKNPVEFLRLISNAYPHNVGYFYLTQYPAKEVEKMYIDHFESCYTPSWESLSHFAGLTVVYKGGNCNCLVSIADILLRVAVMELKKKHEDFRKEGLERVFSIFPWAKKVFIHELGGNTAILRLMTPVNRRPIELTPFIARPLIFVPTENLSGIQIKEERELFEALPVFDDLSNFLFLTKGSFKYFRADADLRIGKDGDYFLVLGENSDKLYAYLKNCGTNLSKITPEQLREKNNST
jgi:hypothetical protein